MQKRASSHPTRFAAVIAGVALALCTAPGATARDASATDEPEFPEVVAAPDPFETMIDVLADGYQFDEPLELYDEDVFVRLRAFPQSDTFVAVELRF